MAPEWPDYLQDMLQKAFTYKPKFLTQSPHAEQHPFDATLPFNFYDRHLDSNLALKRVVLMPSIPTDLASKFDSTLADLRDRKIGPLPVNADTAVHVKRGLYMDNVRGIITPLTMLPRYVKSFGTIFPVFASSWIVHPLLPQYISALEFSDHPLGEIQESGWNVITQHALRFKSFDEQLQPVLESIDDETKAALKDLAGKDLFTCAFVHMCSETEELFRKMDELPGTTLSAAYTTSGFQGAPRPLNRPCDAKKTPWTLPPSVGEPLQHDKDPSNHKTPRQDIQPSLREEAKCEFEEMKSMTAAGLLHNIWHRSVAENTTLILLSCGNYERIGIRHRDSQTLFLSELLDITKFDEPSYGKVQFGLFLSAVDDALDRHRQTYTAPVLAKRAHDDTEPTNVRRSKRQKVKRSMTRVLKFASSERNLQSIGKALQSRSLSLVSVKFGLLNSPVPAACLRTGGILSALGVGSNSPTWKKVYQFSDCFTLTLDSDIGSGATGRVHSARLEVETAGGKSSLEVAVKSAVHPKFRDRLRREYSVYRHLWQHSVPNIPIVYGLFEDSDDMVTFLVLQKLCQSFRDREPYEGEDGLLLSVTSRERSICLSTLRKIHQAGVVHGDLRAENILIAEDGTPMIIDFDHGMLNPDPSQMEEEFNCFRDILDGNTIGQVLFSFASTDG